MSHLPATLLALAGFALIALSMGRHQTAIVGRRLSPSTSRRARVAGYALLALALLLDLAVFGGAYGAVAWWGHLSVGAWSVVAWLTWRTRRRPDCSNTSAFPEGEN